MEISVYAFEDRDGNSITLWTTQDYEEAKEYAQEHHCRVIERTFVYSHSDMVDDFTEEEEEPGEDEEELPLCEDCGEELHPAEFDDRDDDFIDYCAHCARRKGWTRAQSLIDAAYQKA